MASPTPPDVNLHHDGGSPPPQIPNYSVGTTLNLCMNGDAATTATEVFKAVIEHAFVPFTESQILRVTLCQDAGVTSTALPSSAILKLYDRRCVKRDDERLWSLEAESAARSAWREKRSGLIENIDELEALDSADTIPFDPAQIEDFLWWTMETRFKTEKGAYERLLPLQGKFIPRCYAAVQVEPLVEDRDLPEAAVYGLLLEDVGGVKLNDFDADEHDLVSASHALLAALEMFPSYGVIHRGINSWHVLVCPSATFPLNRLVLIDLSEAWLKGDVDEPMGSDDAFQQEIEVSRDMDFLRFSLQRRHVRVGSPQPARSPAYDTWDIGDGRLLKKPSSLTEVQRWYEPRELDNPEPNPFESKREARRLKPGVWEWMETRPKGVEAFYVQRPGSPDKHVVPPEFRVSPA